MEVYGKYFSMEVAWAELWVRGMDVWPFLALEEERVEYLL